MDFEVTFNYSPELSAKISKEFLALRNGSSSVFSLVIFGVVGIAASFIPSLRWVGGFLVATVIIYIAQLIRYLRNAKRLANDLPNKSIVVKFNDECVAFQSDGHTSTVEWKRFERVWITKHAWLFFIYATDVYTAIPINCVDEKLSSFILNKVAKDKVKDYQSKKR
ncbi:MAG: YcxB family protein [Chloroflexi bacterium]|nr:YcxB family protein [Chloroflexota bacterium]